MDFCDEAAETIRQYPGSEAQVIFDLSHAIESLQYNMMGGPAWALK